MPVEGHRNDEPALHRRKGKLVNTSSFELSGRRWFACDCDCGNKGVKVPARAFNDGKVTACEECREAGKAPKMYDHIRLSVTLDREVFAALGVDLDLKENRSASPVRQALEDFAFVLTESSTTQLMSDEMWRRCAAVVYEHPELLHSSPTPKARLFQIAEKATDEEVALSTVQTMSSLHALAVLATLRWRLDHKQVKGDWWRIERRIGSE